MREKTKLNNDKYTQECKEIYDNLHFARIRVVKLWSEILYCVCSIFIVSIIAIISGYLIPSFFREQRNILVDIVSSVFIIVFIFIIVMSISFCINSYNKKFRQFYIIKNDVGEFMLDVKNIDGKLYLYYIANTNKRKGLVIEGEKVSIYSWSEKDILSEDIGFYEFIVPPSKVCPKRNFKNNSRYLYKNKKIVSNKVYYHFRSFGGVVGARYSRCIKLKDNVIKYITTQKFYGYTSNGTNIYDNLKYVYEFVNDDNLKIYIPKYAVDYAKNHKFVLPMECNNLVCEE